MMKKFVAVLALAGSLAACNNAADSAGTKKDSLDSAAAETKDMIDSAAAARKDVVDSTTEAKKDRIDSLHKGDSTHK
jgi:uncharacterized lipoprotein NlpE involved in copper resistance